jgi:hypothetical protein
MAVMTSVEAIRAQYRPAKIKTLFIGESAPHSGHFFYCGDTQMLRYMRTVVERGLGASDNFLKTFMGYGWYLDDLVLSPVNQEKNKAKRRALCLAAQNSLTKRIATYQPEAIVVLLKSIEPFVRGATAAAGSNAPVHVVPFPGNGQQGRFDMAMTLLIPKLPRANDLA